MRGFFLRFFPFLSKVASFGNHGAAPPPSMPTRLGLPPPGPTILVAALSTCLALSSSDSPAAASRALAPAPWATGLHKAGEEVLAYRKRRRPGGAAGSRHNRAARAESVPSKASLTPGQELARHVNTDASCGAAMSSERERFDGWSRMSGTNNGCMHEAFDEVAVSHEHKIVYVANQKAASEALLKMMHKTLHAKQHCQKGIDFRKVEKPLQRCPYHRLPYRAAKIGKESDSRRSNLCYSEGITEAWANYTWFTVVADPLGTALKAYLEVSYRTGPRLLPVRCDRPRKRYEAFVDALATAEAPMGMHLYHAWPQAVKTDVLPPGRGWDFIGRVERLQDDICDLLTLAGSPRMCGAVQRQLAKHVTHRQGEDQCMQHIEDTVPNPATEEKMRHLYRADCLCFGSGTCDLPRANSSRADAVTEQAAPPQRWKQMSAEGHHCPRGQRNARKEECEDAVKAATQDVVAWKVVDEGKDSRVPHGCSYNTLFKTALWNAGAGGRKLGTYRLVCTDKTKASPHHGSFKARKLAARPLPSPEPAAAAGEAGGCHSMAGLLAMDEWCSSNCAVGTCPEDVCSSECRKSS